MLNLKKKIEKYKAVFIDIDNTLFNYTYAHRVALGSVLDKFKYREHDYNVAKIQIKKRNLKVNHHKKELYFKVMAEMKGRPLTEVIKMTTEYENEFLGNIRSDYSMYEALKHAHLSGKKVIAITNFYITNQLMKLKSSKFIDYIDFMITSEEFEEEKPNRKLFDRAYELAGSPKLDEIIMFGDSLVDDMTSFGIDYCPYNCSKLMISITGKSGVGKSTISKQIQDMFGAFIIEGDGYHKYERSHEKWDNLTHYNPEANNLIRLGLDIKNIYHDMSGSTIPIYDHHTGTFDKEIKYNPDELDVVIIDGLHSLYPEVTGDYVKIKIFIDSDNSDNQKIIRDVSERNKTMDEVVQSISKRQEDYDKYIAIQREYANFVITIRDNQFNILLSDDFNLELLNRKAFTGDIKFLPKCMNILFNNLFSGRYL